MFEIVDIKARMVLDSRGNPTVEAEVFTQEQSACAIVFSENIEEYMQVSNNDFIISPKNKSIELEFRAYNFDNLTQGNYAGNAYIYYFRP